MLVVLAYLMLNKHCLHQSEFEPPRLVEIAFAAATIIDPIRQPKSLHTEHGAQSP